MDEESIVFSAPLREPIISRRGAEENPKTSFFLVLTCDFKNRQTYLIYFHTFFSSTALKTWFLIKKCKTYNVKCKNVSMFFPLPKRK
jgi:hypothetical protein